MLISTKGRYAMRFMIDLALRGPEEKVSLREIAEFEGISLRFLNNWCVRSHKLDLSRECEAKTVATALRNPQAKLKPVMCYVPWKAPRSPLHAAL